MANYIRLPNGSYYEAKEGQSPSDAFRDAYKFYPEAFGETESKPKQDTTGFKAAASAGATRLGGEFELLKGKLGLKSEAEAQKNMKPRKSRSRALYSYRKRLD